eukprot:gnl/MRDRNA2_/MRDRNA2_29080_c0_seq1.p1 gnl/MRDRNA2_/MRDRNA2_29080_c0~~gnl/MRDRNA2_/MRDRNA2_29080_c0_seq1.p1  ORF type:complete len:146 (+),score=31.24 gnl/MRDRNA2_/MRDRNA2_29080_c0_seq1:72-509(+)
MTTSKVGSPDVFCGVSEVTLARAAKATCQGGPSCASPPICGKLYDQSVDSVKVDLNAIAPCPTLLEKRHALGTLTPSEIEEERQRRRKNLESLREKRLQEEYSYKAEERRRQDQREAYEESARRVKQEFERQLRLESAYCPCFVA